MRAFNLTKHAAMLNPANYTVWYYRRILLKELNLDLNQELAFITDVILGNPKNYQVWQHRRSLVDWLQNPSNELKFTEQILKKDSKNYHAWQYRQWAIKKFGLWDHEINFINFLLKQDIRNNSAWNQRYFYISNKNDLNHIDSIKVLNEEIDFCLEKIEACIDNESSWNYLRALISHLNNLNNENKSNYPKKVVDFCERVMTSKKEDAESPFLIAFLVDLNYLKAKELDEKLKHEKTEEGVSSMKGMVKNSIEMLDSLACKHDLIRFNYWNYLISKWRHEFPEYV